MNPQYFTVEKDVAPMYISRPWQVRCHAGDGPFKPHVTGGFHTKARALAYAKAMEKIVAQELMNE